MDNKTLIKIVAGCLVINVVFYFLANAYLLIISI